MIHRLKRWDYLNPKPKCMRVVDNKCRKTVVDLKAPYLLETYDKLTAIAFRTDMWRLCALYTHGGMYSDLNILCTNPSLLSSLLEEYDYLFCVDKTGQELRICNSWMFVKRSKSELLWSAINKIKENVCRKMWYTDPLEFTGSTMFTKLLKSRLKMQDVQKAPFVEEELDGQLYGFLSYERTSPSHYEISFRNSTLMICGYPNYRNDLRSLGCGEHFSKLHSQKRIYL